MQGPGAHARAPRRRAGVPRHRAARDPGRAPSSPQRRPLLPNPNTITAPHPRAAARCRSACRTCGRRRTPQTWAPAAQPRPLAAPALALEHEAHCAEQDLRAGAPARLPGAAQSASQSPRPCMQQRSPWPGVQCRAVVEAQAPGDGFLVTAVLLQRCHPKGHLPGPGCRHAALCAPPGPRRL
jgi:hypothetical protein